MNSFSVTLVLLLIAPAVAALADDTRRNPFAHPEKVISPSAAGDSSAANTSTDIRIRAILLAGKESLISIDGELLGIGETHRGFILQSVQEDAAIFVRDDETLTVPLFEQRESDNDT